MESKQDKATELILADAFLKKEFERIVRWVVGDIKKCCRIKDDGNCDENGALVGAFILWCCAIDYFGGLYTGHVANTRERMTSFITKYMPAYDPDKVYDLRWSLLHYYSPQHFVLYHENNINENKSMHLLSANKRIFLHLGSAVNDIDKAVNNYKHDLETNDKLKLIAWRYYKKHLPIMPLKIEKLIPVDYRSIASGASLSAISLSGAIDRK